MIDYIKRLFKEPTEIYIARNMKNSHYFLFVLLMGVLMTFLSLFEIKPEFDQLAKDYDEIASFIPDFELVDGALESEDASYIYETDYIVFYFDPDNIVEPDLIDQNMKRQSAPISVGLLNQEIYLNVLDKKQKIRYTDFSLTANELKSTILSFGSFNFLIYGLIVTILFVINLFMYLTQLLSISIFANLISVIQRSSLHFLQNAKIALLASMIPFLTISISNAFQIPLNFQFEIVSVASLVLFSMSIKEFKNRLKKQSDSKKK